MFDLIIFLSLIQGVWNKHDVSLKYKPETLTLGSMVGGGAQYGQFLHTAENHLEQIFKIHKRNASFIK